MSYHQVSEWFVKVDTNASKDSVDRLMIKLSESHFIEDWWLEYGEVTVDGIDCSRSAKEINDELLLLV